MKTPRLYCLPLPLFQILSTPPPLPTPIPTALSVVLFLWLNWWSHYIWCAILLNDIMDLHMLRLDTLVPERPCCVFHATRHHVYWGLIHNLVFCWYFDLISHTQTHTYTYTKTRHILEPVDWHTHTNAYLHHLLCTWRSYLYDSESIIH